MPNNPQQFPGQHLLIGPTGSLEDIDGAMHRVSGSNGRDQALDCTSFLCRNKSYIALCVSETHIVCRLRPLTASRSGLDRTRVILARSAVPVTLQLWIKGWMTESYPFGRAAAERLDALTAGPLEIERPAASILTAEQSPDHLLDDDAHPFNVTILRWRLNTRRITKATLEHLVRSGLTDRMTIAEITDDQPLGVVRYHGPSITVFGADFPYTAIGLPITKMPDKTYGESVGQTYARVAASDTPYTDHVDALIRERDGTTRRSRYERLILPVKDERSRQLVMSMSRLKPDIQIPLYT